MEHNGIEPAGAAELVAALTEKLRAYYVFPDVAEEICRRLQKHLHDGDYDDYRRDSLLALTLTMHLQEVNGDEHLWVRWHAEPLPEDDGALRLNEEWQQERRLEARLNNYGLHRVERLPGNVGYLDIHYFHRPEWGGDTAVAAMTFMANTQALIIDLRRCGGGYPGMVTLISSYLFGEQPVHLNSIYWRDDDATQQYWTLPFVPGQRSADKPVYLLVSKQTFSAGEGFAYSLQARKRATVIGQQTDGGANPGASYRLHPHFELFVPVGRAIEPITGGNWQGTGVTPDILVPPEEALDTAYRMALEAVIEGLGAPASEVKKALLKEARTALNQF